MVIARGFWDTAEDKLGKPLRTKGLQLRRTLGWRYKPENHLLPDDIFLGSTNSQHCLDLCFPWKARYNKPLFKNGMFIFSMNLVV